jgi:polyhydroxybutyrate depolymerase
MKQIVDELAKDLWIDQNRIHACGLSNGGMMSYRLASELSDRIASIAIVAGTVALEDCKPKRPVPVLHIHGTADNIVPFQMTEKNMPPFMKVKTVQDSIKLWVKLNGCTEQPEVEQVSKPDDLKVVRKRHNNGKNGSEVILVEVEEGGHTWPGMPPPLKVFGKSAKVSANDMIWDFFQKHPMK